MGGDTFHGGYVGGERHLISIPDDSPSLRLISFVSEELINTQSVNQ